MRPAVAWRLLLGIALLGVTAQLWINAALAYGFTSDELYFLDSVHRLAWGYVDHPPLAVAVLAGVTTLLGDSLVAIRLVPALLGGVAVALTGLMAREMGGGRAAQGLAALAALLTPVFLAMTHSYQINAFDLVFWCLAVLLVLRILNGADPRSWLLLGGVLGVGLLNKYTLLWLGAGLLLGLLLTPQRRWLVTPWPWLAVAIAFALFAPHLAWQLQHDWPTVEYAQRKAEVQLLPTTPLSFALDQFMTVNPFYAPFWIGGLLYLLFAREMRSYRPVAFTWLTVIGLLMASGSARSYYAAAAYPVLLAAGARGVERLARQRSWRWLPAATAVGLLVSGGSGLPYALPLLSPERFIAYRNLLAFRVPKQQVDDAPGLPAHLANHLHGRAVFEAIAGVYRTLPEADRARAGIFTTHQGQAGAVNYWGPDSGLPRAIGNHNSYWLWGPGGTTGEVMIVVWPRDDDLGWWFGDVERVADFDCSHCLASLTRQSVYVGREPKRPLPELWPRLKNYR